MKLADIKDMEFWTRELKLPLFRMTDKNHKLFSQGMLVFYRRNVIHLYASSERRKKLSKEGYDFFKHEQNVIAYEKQSTDTLEKMDQLVDYFGGKKVKDISNDGIRFFYSEFIKILNLYSHIYAKTEPFRMEKFEQESGKYKDTIEKLSNIRFELRKEGEAVFYNFIGILIKEIGKRFDVKVTELYFYTYGEMILLLAENKKVRGDIIDRRKKGYILLIDSQKQTIVTGKGFINIFRKFKNHENNENKKLKGSIAVKGIARGKVRLIIHNRKDVSKKVLCFQKGEILVTEMTRPGTIMACNKAAAIITDEGGITCHAAIVARELGIPCIIGTKIATQVLHDGDLVEVDANEGIIRILK
ncbi:MAG TPA: hypothetical protein DIC35_01905 [Candidatus Moranbacteria bacterium]|nr:hypothetical protein [Candidatus Moranbacteria bacterium]